jgi:hypothetical protein
MGVQIDLEFEEKDSMANCAFFFDFCIDKFENRKFAIAGFHFRIVFPD